jgi:hypothetical protein
LIPGAGQGRFAVERLFSKKSLFFWEWIATQKDATAQAYAELLKLGVGKESAWGKLLSTEFARSALGGPVLLLIFLEEPFSAKFQAEPYLKTHVAINWNPMKRNESIVDAMGNSSVYSSLDDPKKMFKNVPYFKVINRTLQNEMLTKAAKSDRDRTVKKELSLPFIDAFHPEKGYVQKYRFEKITFGVSLERSESWSLERGGKKYDILGAPTRIANAFVYRIKQSTPQ